MRPTPMKAISGDLPADDGRWWFEIKWDGMRVTARIDPDAGSSGRVELRNARGVDVTSGFPELAGLGDAVASECVLDGEVVAFSDRGVPDFGLLQQRMHVTDASDAARRSTEVPVVFVAFDVLSVDGRATTSLPYRDRRSILEELVEPNAVVQVPPAYRSGGADLLAAAREQGLEGVVAKRVDSTYESGRRTPAWRKVKVRHTQELVVGGWVGGTGARTSTIGSLVLGCHREGPGGEPVLVWVGNVGTGFRDDELRRLRGLLAPIATDDPPFHVGTVGSGPVAERPRAPGGRRLHWVQPQLVVQVEFGEWTAAGRLRHPVYLGQRDDKDAADVTCDP